MVSLPIKLRMGLPGTMILFIEYTNAYAAWLQL